MKELDSFTVEQLKDFIESDHAQCGDIAALARIALAAKRAEPDYYIVRLEHSDAWGKEVVLNTYEINLDAIKSKADHGGEIIPAYPTPQLNSPEIRKLILSEVSDFCAGLGQPGEPELPEDIQQALMNRIELVFNNCG
ncbi:hypothetical protein [Yersinia kristensenii]|uniref:hypothetical protein n=1 Tax=Yersinia kristensenii TaxID=28152 RepID=UPI0005DDBC88|nr:hypothetical protein [Yersinia kristensenii]CNK92887.1 Uncharacterised protein [Yersinia kristensenii]